MRASARPTNCSQLPREDQDDWYAKHIEPKAQLSNELVTEDQAALEFAREYEGRLRFCHDAGVWYEWNGSILATKPNRACLPIRKATSSRPCDSRNR